MSEDAMPLGKDALLGKLAVERGYLTRAHLDKARASLASWLVVVMMMASTRCATVV